jgi:DNA helicase-2/ATP-dependent DNA helicase PcrA
MTSTPSPLQQAAYDFIRVGSGNAIIEAVAGSGKTTTGVGMVKQIPSGKSHVFLAFNKAIATELSNRGINGRTFHSMCFSPVTRAKATSNVESNKLRILIDDAVNNSENTDLPEGHRFPTLSRRDAQLYGNFIVRLVGLARNSGVGCLCQNIPEVWQALVEYHDLELDNDAATVDRAIELAMTLLEWSNKSALVDFDDLLYYAVKDGISLPKFDYVFVDEAQDTNAIQRAILRKIMKPTSRFIAVGDPAQAIYGFRGADSNSMNMIADEFGCAKLPLTVTYRCATAIVDFAKQWVSHIEAAPNAPTGSVVDLGDSWNSRDFDATDLVVCRTSKPLVAMAYGFIRDRVPCHVMGRDIGEGLKSLIKKMNGKGIDGLVDKLEIYTEREAEKATAKGQEAKAEAIRDKTESIMVMIEGLDENNRTIPALLRSIDELFDSSRGGVTLATIHKSKGLEANRVFWLNASQCPAQWAKQEWQKQQERNLCYVAATRAKTALVTIEERAKAKGVTKREAAEALA